MLNKKILFALSFLSTSITANTAENIQINTLKNSTLTVCTTGDYPPLTSYNIDTRQYEGFAPVVVKNFAKHMNLKLEFQKTTWQQLSSDLMAKKCDMAIGGITYTEGRNDLFYLTEPIIKSQKAVLFTKENAHLFKRFSDIDKRENVIIENKGGTNEIYVNKIIKNADIKIIESNIAVFDCFEKYQEKPYAMITDSVEVEYRSNSSDSVFSNEGLNMELNHNPERYKVYMANQTTKGKAIILAMNDFIRTHRKEVDHWFQESLSGTYHEDEAVCPF
ncbi:hypothetical protein BS333_07370 [Vibrio azureus]|uniref:Solute-binding protein family 3/N-terminal domain-containing protein n=1 Tax=Vibrio azureus NBRC 104587 TaxID=1219077 RepID=U3C9T6_9VIBR|nr:transporter substrate-binding domain-containing protein [Vibrio azureus]AUI86223.1 hypothetical protein BS333_07370 [Vibrio azureus]GAD78119.1 hypothetical protein VAZ01S_128_00020 [Vibrio azureus NBRC 104587]